MEVELNVRLQEAPLDAAGQCATFQQAWSGHGAVVTFTGNVRPEHEGQPVDYLHLDWYPGMSQASIETIARSAAGRFAVSAICVIHRCGPVFAGEAIVFVATASAHRRAAFDAADYLMDRLKSEAALWKREVGPDRNQWVEPTVADAAACQRWENRDEPIVSPG